MSPQRLPAKVVVRATLVGLLASSLSYSPRLPSYPVTCSASGETDAVFVSRYSSGAATDFHRLPLHQSCNELQCSISKNEIRCNKKNMFFRLMRGDERAINRRGRGERREELFFV